MQVINDLIMMTCILHNLCLSNQEDIQCFQSDFEDSQASDDTILFESDVAGIMKKQKS